MDYKNHSTFFQHFFEKYHEYPTLLKDTENDLIKLYNNETPLNIIETLKECHYYEFDKYKYCLILCRKLDNINFQELNPYIQHDLFSYYENFFELYAFQRKYEKHNVINLINYILQNPETAKDALDFWPEIILLELYKNNKAMWYSLCYVCHDYIYERVLLSNFYFSRKLFEKAQNDCRITKDICDSATLNNVVRINDIELLKYMFSLGYRSNDSSLYDAIKIGNIEMIQFIHDKTDQSYESGHLEYAYECKNQMLVEFFKKQDFERHADIYRPLIKQKNYSEIQNLIDNDYPVVTTGSLCDGELIGCAVIDGDIEMINFLLDRGFILTVMTLYCATDNFKNGVEMIKFLTTRGLICDSYVYYYACENGNVDVLNFLIENNVPFDEKLVVYNCAIRDKHVKILKILLENKKLFNFSISLDLFRVALTSGCVECLQLLMPYAQSYIHEYCVDLYGTLIEIVSLGHLDMLKFLLKFSTRINKTISNNKLTNLLTVSLNMGRCDIAFYLLTKIRFITKKLFYDGLRSKNSKIIKKMYYKLKTEIPKFYEKEHVIKELFIFGCYDTINFLRNKQML